jgi:hypothetical protein
VTNVHTQNKVLVQPQSTAENFGKKKVSLSQQLRQRKAKLSRSKTNKAQRRSIS